MNTLHLGALVVISMAGVVYAAEYQPSPEAMKWAIRTNNRMRGLEPRDPSSAYTKYLDSARAKLELGDISLTAVIQNPKLLRQLPSKPALKVEIAKPFVEQTFVVVSEDEAPVKDAKQATLKLPAIAAVTKAAMPKKEDYKRTPIAALKPQLKIEIESDFF